MREERQNAVLDKALGFRSTVRPGTRNGVLDGSLVSHKVPPEWTLRRLSTRTSEMESPSVGADCHAP